MIGVDKRPGVEATTSARPRFRPYVGRPEERWRFATFKIERMKRELIHEGRSWARRGQGGRTRLQRQPAGSGSVPFTNQVGQRSARASAVRPPPACRVFFCAQAHR
jgi:hypothetical protein